MKRNIAILVFFCAAFLMSDSFASAQTSTSTPSLDTQALIKQLQELVLSLQTQINELKVKLEATQKDVEVVKSEIQFTAFLSKGSQGDEVTQLQEILKQDPEIYPEGQVTGFFGQRTEAAVKRFQQKHGIEALGIIGPKTRAKLNELISEGAGQSGNIPPGLLRAPGIQKKLGVEPEEATPPSPTPSGTIPAIPGQQATSTSIATSTLAGLPPPTPSGTIPAQSATTTTFTPPPSSTPPPSGTPPPAATPPPPPPAGTSTTTAPSAPPPATPPPPTSTTASYVPTNLSATPFSSSQINLSWTGSTNVAVAWYVVLRCTGSNCTATTEIARPSGTSYIDTGLSTSTAYTYRVFSSDAMGFALAYSGSASATTLASPPQTSQIPQVQGFTATVSGSSVNLSWQDVTGTYSLAGLPNNMFGSYNIYRGSSADFTPSLTWPTDNHIVQGSVLSYTDSNRPAGTYYYKIALQDKNGTVGPASSAVSAVVAGPPTPTNVQAVTSSSSQSQPPQIWYYLTFNYTLQSTIQSFNVYRKRPSDASFVKYTYSAQTPVNPSILPLPGSNESNLYHRDVNGWQWWTTLPAPAPDTAQGEYKFYVTAIDTSGIESAMSETKSFKLYAAPVITSPADGSTVSSPFTITVSGDPSASSPTYGMALYKKTTGDTAWSAWPAPSTNFTYSGSALSANDNPHRLVVWFSSGSSDRSFFGTSIFNTGTTTSSTHLNADSELAQILTALLKTLQTLTQVLRGQ